MYVPLKVFSAFSLHDSVIDIKSLVSQAKLMQFPALALTDRSNMFAMVSFYQKALAAGIKPILSASIVLRVLDKKVNCALLCQNIKGFEVLSQKISSLFKKQPFDNIVELQDFQGQENLILIPDQSDLLELDNLIPKALSELKKIFGEDRLFLGIERYLNDQTSYNQSIEVLEIGHRYNIPVVVANRVFFLKADDYESQQIKYCIQRSQYYDDQSRTIKHYPSQYLYDAEQMQSLFDDCLGALENTIVIAKKCTANLDFKSIFLPQFSSDENLTLKEMSYEGLTERQSLGQLYFDDWKRYSERLDIELEVIRTMGFAGYFLIVADFIQWSKDQKIPVGPGRGSGAGSLVAYALKITDLDPLRYNLLFERFLNPERVSMPDFDIDFCMERRDEVIQYVQRRYGVNNVSQIATFGTMAAKAVVRDVGRVLNHPYGFVDKIAKLIPMDIGITLKQALEQSDQLRLLYDTDEVVTELINLSLKLEGLPRNVGKHAGGVIIAPKSLDYFCPLYNEPNTAWQPVSQLDKDDIERLGLVKFDFLGLKTLTVIDWTYQNLEGFKTIAPLDQVPFDCPRSFKHLQNANTTAVFQLESRGMKQLIIKLQPDCFEDMIALVALFRPGPLQSGMVDDFIDRKHGRSDIVYLHPALEGILEPTYGVILYQEQVMQIAQVLAGYTLGQADLLRRAMGKKKPEEMAKQREIFRTGCLANQVDESCAMEIFDLMEKFAGYGFNKSHSAAYALIAYQTLYLKTHAPAAFFAANMSADYGNLDKIKNLIFDAREDGIDVLPPDINRSEKHFKPLSDNQVSYGLIAIKGLGEQVIDHIISTRKADGPFLSFDDFMERTASSKIQRRTLEILSHAGLFDCFSLNRKSFVDILIEKKIHQYYLSDQRQGLLFAFDEVEEDIPFISDYLWSEKLKFESSLLGLSFSGEILDPYKRVNNNSYKFLSDLPSLNAEDNFLVCCAPLRELTTGAGKKLAIMNFFDGKEQCDILVDKNKSEETLTQYTELQSLGKPLIASIKKTQGKNKKEYLNLEKLMTFEDFIRQNCKNLEVVLHVNRKLDHNLENFISELPFFNIPVDVIVKIQHDKEPVELTYVNDCSGMSSEKDINTLIEQVYPLELEVSLY